MIDQERRIYLLEQEITTLKSQVKDLTMRLSAVKVIVTKINPICSEKLQHLFEECEGCNVDTDND